MARRREAGTGVRGRRRAASGAARFREDFAEAGSGAGTPNAGRARRPASLRRGPLPSGRALAGGVLVGVAALLAFGAAGGARDGRDSQPVVVAAADVAPGTRLEPGHLRVERLALPPSLAGRVAAAAQPLLGAVTLAPLREGDLVQASSVTAGSAAPAGHELSLALPAERAVQDRLRAGERVDVLATSGSGASASTEVVVEGALVRQRAEADAGFGGATVVVTLALDDVDDAVAVAHAARAGEVTLVRRPGATAGRADDPVGAA